MGDPDPEHEIEQWTSILGVPTWVDKKAYRQCKQCKKTFTKGHQHHCRGCGEMFCSQCTVKFYVPEHLIGKDKKGPTRVCISCRDKCLMERQKINGDVLTERRLCLQYTKDSDRKYIHPPAKYVDPFVLEKCGVCSVRTRSLINCSVCGDAICEECTNTDVVVPPAFKPPKTKPGVICKQCRFYSCDGAIFVLIPPSRNPEWAGIRAVTRDSINSPTPTDQGFDFADEKNVETSSAFRASTQLLQDAAASANRKSNPRSTTVRKKTLGAPASSQVRRFSEMRNVIAKGAESASPLRPSISFKAIEADLAANGTSTNPAESMSPTNSQMGFSPVPPVKPIATTPLSIRFEGHTQDIAILEVREWDTLNTLFHKLKVIIPSVANGNHSFSYNGVPIRSEHWKLIEAKKLFPVVYLKEGNYDYIRRSQQEQLGLVQFDFDAENSSMLTLRKDQNILLVKFDLSSKWWFGYSADRSQYGWFPQDRVKIVEQSQ